MAEQQTHQRPANLRRYPRINLPKGMMVAWQGGGQRDAGRIGTLSLGGIYIRTPNPSLAGTLLLMVFEVPGGDVRARGVVVHVQPGKGMGIQFRGMVATERARLAQLLKRLLR